MDHCISLNVMLCVIYAFRIGIKILLGHFSSSMTQLGAGCVTEWYQSLSSTLDPYGPRTNVNLGKIRCYRF
jgi:hypothetical protein